MKIRYILLSIAFFSYTCPVFSGVYKQIDEQGNVTYSNVQSHAAEKVKLPPITLVPSVDSEDIDARIQKRRENNKISDQRKEMEQRITDESDQLEALKAEYKDGNPDRLGSERNYQRYLDRVERLKNEINVRETNLRTLQREMDKLSEMQ